MTTALPAQATPSDSPLPDMRHLRLVGDTAQSGTPRTSHGRRVDHARHVAEVNGRELGLTYLEFGLPAHLVLHPHQVHSREQLMAGTWGYGHIGDGRTADVHIARLRRKRGPDHRHRIVTVRRVGYKYVPDQQESPNTAPCRRP
ncbi:MULTISPECIES: response regulator transcription factor [unclassified Streptomyces]|uniref:winged helix-turn-helix domain-containing protein n=1 Tax=Streptomyces sp. Ag109_G2-15 TaxID=1938850 RepID=UPI000BD16170|nr:Transcriptional regulatory protein, C terminal [Streptomyces sp. Ag109_G2-15]